MIETWAKIKNTDYFVSNKGKIKNKFNEILKPYTDKDKYLGIKIRINKKPYNFKVHRLVAEAFLQEFDKNLEVNHKDGNKQNNYINNLEMVTRKENMQHSYYVLNKNIKKVNQYDLNGVFIKCWNSAKEIEKNLGFKQYNICRVCNGLRKTCGNYIWKYER